MSNFVFDRMKAFGWIIHRKQLSAGESYTVTVDEDMLPSESENITLWTRGLITGKRQDGYEPAARAAGRFSLDSGALLAGEFVFTCIEDAEWFCINYRANRNSLPTVTAFRLATGESTSLPAGTLLLVCTGALNTAGGVINAGEELQTTSTASVTATTQVYGLIFAEERA